MGGSHGKATQAEISPKNKMWKKMSSVPDIPTAAPLSNGLANRSRTSTSTDNLRFNSGEEENMDNHKTMEYVEDGVTLDFDWEEEDISISAGSEKLVEPEGLTDEFNTWFRKRRTLFNHPFTDNENNNGHYQKKLKVASHQPLQALMNYQHEVCYHYPRVKEAASHPELRDIRFKPESENYSQIPVQGSEDPIRIQSPVLNKLNNPSPKTRNRLSHPEKEMVLRDHQAWSSKRALPEGYTKSHTDTQRQRCWSGNSKAEMIKNRNQFRHTVSPLVNSENTNISRHTVSPLVSLENRSIHLQKASDSNAASSPATQDNHDNKSHGKSSVHSKNFYSWVLRKSPHSPPVISTGFDDPSADNRTENQLIKQEFWEPEPDYDLGETDVDNYDITSGEQSVPVSGDIRSSVHRIQFVDKSRDLPDVVKVKLPDNYDPKNFLDKVPDVDTAGKTIPPWKKLLVARQLAEKTKKDTEEQKKKEEEEARFRNMPLWKRALIQKKEGETSGPAVTSSDVSKPGTKPINTDTALDDDGLPAVPWQNGLHLKPTKVQ